MKALRILSAAVLAAGALAPAAAAQPSQDPVVVVRGEGVVTSAPDVAWIVVGAEHRAREAAQAQAATARAMAQVRAAIAALGVADDALRTASHDVQLEVEHVGGRQVPRGYVARTRLEARLDDLARVGEALGAAVGAGATHVHGVRFDVKARAAIERDALARAVADARARAEAAAAGAGLALGRILRIEEGAAVPPPVPLMLARAVAEDATAPPVIAPGEIEIRAQVTLTATLRRLNVP